ncbi:MAG TPA: TspO/MBR family protein [Sphingomicrobium sp.]|nr:TspO/MBR family protein [Sphingomicrobium sp.]
MAEAKGREWWKIAIVAVIAFELLGAVSGWVSNSGYGNDWFAGLIKPTFMPPGWAFGVVWPVLYAMLGVALAMVLAQPPSQARRIGLILFGAQMVLNFSWSPLFFAAHDISLAKWVIFLMAALAAAAARQFLKVRRDAGLLMIPYLGWLVFAATLNAAIEALNPQAGRSLLGI